MVNFGSNYASDLKRLDTLLKVLLVSYRKLKSDFKETIFTAKESSSYLDPDYKFLTIE